MATNTRISRRTKIYAKKEGFDTDNMYFNQEMKANDAARFLKEAHKESVDLLSKVNFELITRSLVT